MCVCVCVCVCVLGMTPNEKISKLFLWGVEKEFPSMDNALWDYIETGKTQTYKREKTWNPPWYTVDVHLMGVHKVKTAYFPGH